MSGRLARIAIRLVLLMLLVWLSHWLIGWTMTKGAALKENPMAGIGFLAALLLAYALLIAIPFVPGVELGLTLLMIEGAVIAPFIWAATLLGLTLAFAAGAFLPYPVLRRTLEDLRLTRAAGLVAALEPLDREERLTALRDRLPRWLSPLVRSQRYVLLALLINLPGNSVLGGGGGILLLAGMSRLFSPLATLTTVALAVAPVPVLIYLMGEPLPLPGF